jgi:hypothetical protein
MTSMARGPSGRIVIEIEPELKRELHSALVADGETLKDWFIAQARFFLRERHQPALPGLVAFPRNAAPASSQPVLAAEEGVAYRTRHDRSARSAASPAPASPPFSDE